MRPQKNLIKFVPSSTNTNSNNTNINNNNNNSNNNNVNENKSANKQSNKLNVTNNNNNKSSPKSNKPHQIQILSRHSNDDAQIKTQQQHLVSNSTQFQTINQLNQSKTNKVKFF